MAESVESPQFSDPADAYNDLLHEYYRLKQEYEKKWNKIKRRIKNMNISKKEKRAQLKKQKVKCIQCRRSGGTLFTNKDGILKVICGNKEKPCKLHIELKRGDWGLLPSKIQEAQNNLEHMKKLIIETKLELLFGLEEEDRVVSRFEEIKKRYENWYTHLIDLETFLEEKYNWKERKANIEQDNLKLYILNEEFKEATNEYKKSNNIKNLQEAIEIYIKQILPLEEEILYNKYSSISVCCTTEGSLWCKEDDKKSNKDKDYQYILKTPKIGILQNEGIWEEGTIIAADKI